MPVIEDVSAPGLRVAIVKRRKVPYGFQPVPDGPKVRLSRRPSAMELRLLSLIDIPTRLDAETDTLREAFAAIRREQLAASTVPGAIPDATAAYAAVIESGQRRTGQYGAFELRRECARQGVSFDLATEFPVTGEAVVSSAASHTQVWAAKLQHEWAERVAGAEVRLRAARPFASMGEWRDYAGKGLEIGLKIVARAVVNRSFGSGRLFELKRMKKESEFEPSLICFTSILDANTCFLPGTRILTSHGEIPVEQLHVGQDVICDDGSSQPITEITELWSDDTLAITVGSRTLRCTADHRLWVGRDDYWDWVEAGEVRAGDSVLLNEAAYPCAEDVGPRDDVWQADGDEPRIDGALSLRRVADLHVGVAVPVEAVDVDEHSLVSEEEIPHVGAAVDAGELRFEADVDSLHPLSESPLDGRLSIKGHIAADGAESTSLGRRWRGAELLRTVLARHDHDGSVAVFGTVIGASRSNELLPTTPTVPPFSVGESARIRADGVSCASGSASLKVAPTQAARHRHTPPSRGFSAGVAAIQSSDCSVKLRSAMAALLGGLSEPVWTARKTRGNACLARIGSIDRPLPATLGTRDIDPARKQDALLGQVFSTAGKVTKPTPDSAPVHKCAPAVLADLRGSRDRVSFVGRTLTTELLARDGRDSCRDETFLAARTTRDVDDDGAFCLTLDGARSAEASLGLPSGTSTHESSLTASRADDWRVGEIVSIERLPYEGVVFDLSVAHRHSLVAESILSHNCDSCVDADGTTFLQDSDDAEIMAIPYYLCESIVSGPENLCRCMWVSLGPEEADLIVDHVESVLNLDSASWREWEDGKGERRDGYRKWLGKARPAKHAVDVLHVDYSYGENIYVAVARTPDGKVIGKLDYSLPDFEDAIVIKNVEVAPEHQRQGVATALYDAVLVKHPHLPLRTMGGRTPEGAAFRAAYDKKLGRKIGRQIPNMPGAGLLSRDVVPIDLDSESWREWEERRESSSHAPRPASWGRGAATPTVRPIEPHEIPDADHEQRASSGERVLPGGGTAEHTQYISKAIEDRLFGKPGVVLAIGNDMVDAAATFWPGESFRIESKQVGPDTVALTITNGDGLRIVRQFYPNDKGDGVEVYHDWLVVPKEMQGQGVAAAILGAAMTHYERNGVTHVTTFATKSEGAYAWARYGFLPIRNENPSLTRWINQARDAGRITEAAQRELLPMCTGRKSMWRVADHPDGRAVLAGEGWLGEIRLDNADQMRRFWWYVQERKTKGAATRAAKVAASDYLPGLLDLAVTVGDDQPHFGFVSQDGTVDADAFWAELLGPDDYEPGPDEYAEGEETGEGHGHRRAAERPQEASGLLDAADSPARPRLSPAGEPGPVDAYLLGLPEAAVGALFDHFAVSLDSASWREWEEAQPERQRERREVARRAVTRSPAFKAWFGKSKVVDERGEPKVMYHGTTGRIDFEKFSPDSHFGTISVANAKAREELGTPFGRVYPVYLSIQNPKRVDDAAGKGYGRWEDIVEQAKSEGYDGIVYKNTSEGLGGLSRVHGTDSWIAFHPTQIKSATGNKGTFDPRNPNINMGGGHEALDLDSESWREWEEKHGGKDKGIAREKRQGEIFEPKDGPDQPPPAPPVEPPTRPTITVKVDPFFGRDADFVVGTREDAIQIATKMAESVAPFYDWRESITAKVVKGGADVIGVTISTKDGLNIVRSFRRTDEGYLKVYHASFFVPESRQGEGIAAAVLAASMKEYERIDVDYVEVSAECDAGGYAWARFGFLPTNEPNYPSDEPESLDLTDTLADWIGDADPQQQADVALTRTRQRLMRLVNDGTITQAQKLDAWKVANEKYERDKAPFSAEETEDLLNLAEGPRGLWNVADHPRGRAVLAGNAWHGVIRLNSPQQMQRFWSYANARIAKKPTAVAASWVPATILLLAADPNPGRHRFGYLLPNGTIDADGFWDDLIGDDDYASDEATELDTEFSAGANALAAAFMLDSESWREWEERRGIERSPSARPAAHIEVTDDANFRSAAVAVFGSREKAESHMTAFADAMADATLPFWPGGGGATVMVEALYDHTVEVSLRNMSGLHITRTFSRDAAGKLIAHHDYFRVPKNMQGKGVATAVMAASMKEYQRLGVDQLRVSAELESGAYTWARFGFLPDYTTEVSEESFNARLMSLVERADPDDVANREFDRTRARLNVLRDSSDITPEDYASQMDRAKQKREVDRRPLSENEKGELIKAARGKFALWRVADHPRGKAVLSDWAWTGTLDLHNKAQMKRFNWFVADSAKRRKIAASDLAAFVMSLGEKDTQPKMGFLAPDGTVDAGSFFDELLGADDYQPGADEYDDGAISLDSESWRAWEERQGIMRGGRGRTKATTTVRERRRTDDQVRHAAETRHVAAKPLPAWRTNADADRDAEWLGLMAGTGQGAECRVAQFMDQDPSAALAADHDARCETTKDGNLDDLAPILRMDGGVMVDGGTRDEVLQAMQHIVADELEAAGFGKGAATLIVQRQPPSSGWRGSSCRAFDNIALCPEVYNALVAGAAQRPTDEQGRIDFAQSVQTLVHETLHTKSGLGGDTGLWRDRAMTHQEALGSSTHLAVEEGLVAALTSEITTRLLGSEAHLSQAAYPRYVAGLKLLAPNPSDWVRVHATTTPEARIRLLDTLAYQTMKARAEQAIAASEGTANEWMRNSIAIAKQVIANPRAKFDTSLAGRVILDRGDMRPLITPTDDHQLTLQYFNYLTQKSVPKD